MAKLKSAKEEADAKQVQMQKEIREEMERLRTQYTFKVRRFTTLSSYSFNSEISNTRWRHPLGNLNGPLAPNGLPPRFLLHLSTCLLKCVAGIRKVICAVQDRVIIYMRHPGAHALGHSRRKARGPFGIVRLYQHLKVLRSRQSFLDSIIRLRHPPQSDLLRLGKLRPRRVIKT